MLWCVLFVLYCCLGSIGCWELFCIRADGGVSALVGVPSTTGTGKWGRVELILVCRRIESGDDWPEFHTENSR
jgi:hypothetical protein